MGGHIKLIKGKKIKTKQTIKLTYKGIMKKKINKIKILFFTAHPNSFFSNLESIIP